MSNRYWVGGTGTWDGSSTTHWSATSGGSSGASVPTSVDDVFFDSNSGLSGGTVTLNLSGLSCNNFLSNTGASYTFGSVDDNLSVYGSLTLEAGMTANTAVFLMSATSTGKTITTAGVTIKAINLNGVGGAWTLQDNLIQTSGFYQDNGTFNANNKDVTASDFYFYADTGYNPTVNMGSGTWTATTASDSNFWYIDENNGEVVTINSDTSTIYYATDGADISTFTGGGKTYYNLTLAGVGGAVSNFGIYGSNTFNTFSVLTYPHKVFFNDNSTQTLSDFNVSGTSGNLITLDSVGGVDTFTLSKSSGTVDCDYLDISNSTATGGATWNAGDNSIDNGGNNGWIFGSAPVASNSNFLMFM
jgi:hypothetical protein